MTGHLYLGIAALVALGCGSTDSSSESGRFNPPPEPAGYVRYPLPMIAGIAPGTDVIKCQWLLPPADHDQYVTTVSGSQSRGGHHIVLFATKQLQPVGTTRDCLDADTLEISFLGTYGGEGLSTDSVPEGVAFKLPKGQALMANTHFLNASLNTIDGQGVVDVKYVEAAAVKMVANEFANLSLNFAIPPGKRHTIDVSCKFPQDISFFRLANHMHEWGQSAYTEVRRGPSGPSEILAKNDGWVRDMTFNFPFVSWPLEQPLTIHAGDTLVTHCTWNNTTNRTLRFPDEMCVAFGFFAPSAGPQPNCIDGEWN